MLCLQIRSPKAREKAKKKAKVTAVGGLSYMPIKVPLSRDAHLQAMVVSLEATNAILPFPLCADSMLPLVVALTIFKAMLDSPFVAPKDKA